MPRHIHVLVPTVTNVRTAIWHAAYCRWYDADRAGHHTRADMWGRIADFICP